VYVLRSKLEFMRNLLKCSSDFDFFPFASKQQQQTAVLIFGRPYYRSRLWHIVSSVCHLSVTFCIVAKWYVLAKNCLKEQIGNQGQKVDFFGLPPYFYFRFRLYGHRDGRFCLIFACTAQRSVLDGTSGLSSTNPCVYCRIVRSELKPEVVLDTIIDP